MNQNTLNIEYAAFFNETIEQPSVESALADLCARYDLNRNFLIFCLWFAKTGRGRLRKSVLHDLLRSLLMWHHAVVVNLQQFNDLLNDYLPQTNLAPERIERIKIFANKIYRQAEQRCLLSETALNYHVTDRTEARQLIDAIINMLVYTGLMQVRLTEADSKPFIHLLSGAFSTISLNKIQGAWSTVFSKRQLIMHDGRQQLCFNF